MWKRIYDLVTSFATLAEKVKSQEQAMKDQQREMRELTAFVRQLAFELERLKDEQRHTAEREASEHKHAAEREASERKMFQLQIENQLLKFARQLPPRPDDNDDEDKG